MSKFVINTKHFGKENIFVVNTFQFSEETLNFLYMHFVTHALGMNDWLIIFGQKILFVMKCEFLMTILFVSNK